MIKQFPSDDRVREADAHLPVVWLGRQREERFDRLVRLLRSLCRVQYCAMTVIDGQRQWIKASCGVIPGNTRELLVLCRSAANRTGPTVVPDVDHGRPGVGRPGESARRGIGLFAAMPLRAASGRHIGCVCIAGDKPGSLVDDELVALEDTAKLLEEEILRNRSIHWEHMFSVIKQIAEVSRPNPGDKIREALAIACEYLSMSRGAVSQVMGDDCVCRFVYSTLPWLGLAEGQTVALAESNCASTLTRRDVVICRKKALSGAAYTHACGTYIGVTLVIDNGCFGTLSFACDGLRTRGDVPKHHIEFVRMLARWLEGEIQCQMLTRELVTKRDIERLVLTHQGLGDPGTQQAVDRLLDDLVTLANSDFGCLFVRGQRGFENVEPRIFSCVARSNRSPPQGMRGLLEKVVRPTFDGGGPVIRNHESIPDVAEGPCHVAIVPVHHLNQCIAAVVIVRWRIPFDVGFVDLLKPVAGLFGLALSLIETQWRLNEANLERTAQLNALNEHAIVSMTDRAGLITYVNDKFCQVSGYVSDELIGKNHRILKSSIHDIDFYKQMWRTIKGRRTWKGEICNLRKDGTRYWVDSTITPYLDGDGRIYQFVSIRTDITQLKEEEQLLKALVRLCQETSGENLIVGALDILARELHMPVCTVLLRDPESGGWLVHAVEEGHVDHYRMDDMQLAGSPVEEIGCGNAVVLGRDAVTIYPDDPWIERRCISGYLGVPIKDSCGEVLGVLSVMCKRPVYGTASKRSLIEVYAASIGAEIRRARHEAALASTNSLLERTTEVGRIGTWELDIDTLRPKWSKVTCEIHGYTEQPEFNHVEDLSKFFRHGESRDRIQRSMRRAYDEGKSFDEQFSIVRPTGDEHWVRIVGLPVMEEHKCVKLHGLIQDIDELKRYEEELIKEKERAETANRAKSEFLSSMSHELRTPLNAIIGFAQLLEHGKFDDEASAGHVEEILRAGNHLLMLIDEVLDLAKVESGQFQMVIETVDLSSLVIECVSMVSTLAAKRGIDVRVSDFPRVRVRADAFRLRQSLLNLLSNAIKYNQPGGTVKLLYESAGQHARVGVRDTGPGIPADALEELFEPFNRLGIGDDEVEGTGIGLALTRRFIEMMDGSIEVDSKPGLGSTFWLVLSGLGLLPSQALPAQIVEDSGRSCQSELVRVAPNYSVLYVEDNLVNIKLVEQILAGWNGIEFLSAHDAEDGLLIAQQRLPRLILVDINLPGMNGFQLCKQLRSLQSLQDAFLVAVSANAMKEDIDLGLGVGFDEYVTKPIELGRFNSLLQRIFADSSSETACDEHELRSDDRK